MAQRTGRLRTALRDARRRASSQETIWTRALPTEVAFWRDWIAGRGLEHPWDFERRFDPELPLQEPALLALLDGRPRVRILEVGAGPATWLGRTHPGTELELTPVDPLGDTYAELLREAGLSAPVPTRALAGEDVLATFGDGAFDLAYARNALDHSADPVEIIRQMLCCVVPGGSVVLRHFADEGETMRYEELHQFNFAEEDGRLIVWNRRVRRDVFAELAEAGSGRVVREPGSEHADWIVATIRRHTYRGEIT